MNLNRRVRRLEKSVVTRVDLVAERQMIERWLAGIGPPPTGDRVVYLRNFGDDPADPDRIMFLTEAMGSDTQSVVGPARWPRGGS